MPILDNGKVRNVTVEESGISPDDPTLTECVDCGDPCSEFDDGSTCDDCGRISHAGCQRTTDYGKWCQDCA